MKPPSLSIRRNNPRGISPRWKGTTSIGNAACFRIMCEPVCRSSRYPLFRRKRRSSRAVGMAPPAWANRSGPSKGAGGNPRGSGCGSTWPRNSILLAASAPQQYDKFPLFLEIPSREIPPTLGAVVIRCQAVDFPPRSELGATALPVRAGQSKRLLFFPSP